MEEQDSQWRFGHTYEKSDELRIAERIYQCKCEIRDLQWELDDEEFHFKYIPRRKRRVEEQVVARLKYLIPMGCVLFVCLAILIETIRAIIEIRKNGDIIGESIGYLLMFVLLMLTFGGYFFTRFLLIPELSQLRLLWNSRNTERALLHAKQKNLDTFQKDYEASKSKIAYKKERIETLTQEIQELTDKQKALLEAREQAKERLRAEQVLFDVKPQKKTGSGLTLKERDLFQEDLTQIYEYFEKEQQYYNQYLTDLNVKLQQVEREIVKIAEDYDQVKKRLLFFGMGYIFIVLFQQAFHGNLEVITSLICIVLSVAAILYLEAVCTPAIIRYLVEEEKDIVKEYAFCHNMVPEKYKRREILEEKEECMRELETIRQEQKKYERNE